MPNESPARSAGADSTGDHSSVSTRADERRRRNMGAIILAVVIGILVLWWILMQTTVVPNLTGKDRDAAAQLLRDSSLSEGTVGSIRTSDQLPGLVADQSPYAGARVLKGTDVDFAVASAIGQDDRRGLDSEGELQGFALDPSEIRSGSDLREQPAPRTYPDSSGPYVPMVQGLDEAVAVQVLRSAGYSVTVKYGPVASGPGKGQVYFQDPNPDAYARPGTDIEIWVSTGAPRMGAPDPKPKVSE